MFGTRLAMRAVKMASSMAMFIKALFVASGIRRHVCIFVSAFAVNEFVVGLNLLCLLQIALRLQM